MGPIPERPATRAGQNSPAVFPTGVTAPAPVITTRRLSMAMAPADRRLLVLLDVADGIPDGRDLLRVLVGDLEVKFLLEGHHQLDGVERVGPQVFDELRVGVDLVLFHPELLDDDFHDPLLDRLCHEPLPLPRKLNSHYRDRIAPNPAVPTCTGRRSRGWSAP